MCYVSFAHTNFWKYSLTQVNLLFGWPCDQFIYIWRTERYVGSQLYLEGVLHRKNVRYHFPIFSILLNSWGKQWRFDFSVWSLQPSGLGFNLKPGFLQKGFVVWSARAHHRGSHRWAAPLYFRASQVPTSTAASLALECPLRRGRQP